MLLNPGKLLTSQRSVNKQCVKSLLVGIILGDQIPNIRVCDVLELQVMMESMGMDIPEGVLVDGNHRAKAYHFMGMQISYDLVEAPMSMHYIDSISLEEIYVVGGQQFFEGRRANKYFRPLNESIAQMPLEQVAKLSKQQLQEFPEYRQNALSQDQPLDCCLP